jgi:hypothetical protein
MGRAARQAGGGFRCIGIKIGLREYKNKKLV